MPTVVCKLVGVILQSTWQREKSHNLVSILEKTQMGVFIFSKQGLTLGITWKVKLKVDSIQKTEALFFDVSTVCHDPQTGV